MALSKNRQIRLSLRNSLFRFLLWACVHTPVKDNPRLFNIPPRNSLEWDKEYDRRTSVERSNKREKEDYKLEDGRHRSSMMWYCRPLLHHDAATSGCMGNAIYCGIPVIIKFRRLIMIVYVIPYFFFKT